MLAILKNDSYLLILNYWSIPLTAHYYFSPPPEPYWKTTLIYWLIIFGYLFFYIRQSLAQNECQMLLPSKQEWRSGTFTTFARYSIGISKFDSREYCLNIYVHSYAWALFQFRQNKNQKSRVSFVVLDRWTVAIRFRLNRGLSTTFYIYYPAVRTGNWRHIL